MLALLGFLGLAMSSFVLIDRDESSDDDSTPDADLATDPTNMIEIAPGLFQMLSDGHGDAGAGGVLGEDTGERDGDDYIAIDLLHDAPPSAPAPQPALATASGDGADPEEDHGDDLLPDPTVAVDDARLSGTGGADVLSGGVGADEIAGGDGNDDLSGNLGDDLLWGDDGDDALTGGDGNDLMFGGQGDDTLAGGWGDDLLQGGTGNDLLNGGAGNDTLDGRDDDDGFDYLNGGVGDDLLLAGRGDHLNGGDGSDTFALLSDGGNSIDDFDPTRDLLEITYAGDTPPVLSTTIDDDGVTLLADDAVVARLSGLRALDLATVVLVTA